MDKKKVCWIKKVKVKLRRLQGLSGRSHLDRQIGMFAGQPRGIFGKKKFMHCADVTPSTLGTPTTNGRKEEQLS